MDTTAIMLDLAKVNRNAHTQARAQLCQEAIADYCDVVRDKKHLPPIVVFRRGKNYLIGDGWQRFHAYDQCGMTAIPVDIRPGDLRDALMHAASANAKHGVRRTAADKRLAVEIVLKDEEGKEWSDRKVAEHCGVGHPFVSRIRKDLTPFDDSGGIDSTCDDPPERRIGRDGKKQAAAKQPKKLEGKPERKPAAPKSGREITTPAQRKHCKTLWGQFLRACDVALTKDGVSFSKLCEEEFERIVAKLSAEWGSNRK